MKKEFKLTILAGGFSIIASIITGILSYNQGETTQIEYIESQIANISGSGNDITFNNINDLVDNYNDILSKNKTLIEQNQQYFNKNQELDKTVTNLEAQLNNAPIIEFNNLGLVIEGEDKNVNNEKSQAIINGVEYYSKDFLKSFINDDKTISIKDNTMYLGRIVQEKKNLFSQVIIDSQDYLIRENVTDSYGNKHLKAACMQSDSRVIYNMNNNFNFLKLKIAVSENSKRNSQGVILIKADDKDVYTTDQLNKISTKEIVCLDININKCLKLEIKCIGDIGINPILYEAEIYN